MALRDPSISRLLFFDAGRVHLSNWKKFRIYSPKMSASPSFNEKGTPYNFIIWTLNFDNADKATVTRAAKTGNLNCFGTFYLYGGLERDVAHYILLPTFGKPVLQQIRLSPVAWILTTDWTELRRSHAINGWDLLPSKFALAGKMRNMYRFCCKNYNYSLLSATTFRNP